MKIHIENFLRLKQVNVDLVTPITLVAGSNESGKSSIVDAIRTALLGEPGRVSRKKDWHMLVNDAAQKGLIQLSDDGWLVRVSIPSGSIKTHGRVVPSGHALVSSLTPSYIGTASPNERRSFLFQVLGVQSHGEAIMAKLIARGCDRTKVGQAGGKIAGLGYVGGHDFAAEQASQARGAWKAVTGENYGSEKAETWVPTVPSEPAISTTPVGLQQQIEAAEAKKAELNKRIGGVEAQDAIRTGHATQLAEAEQKAATLSRHKTALAETESQLADAKASLEYWTAKATGSATSTKHWPCPSCGTFLEHGTADGALIEYTPPKIVADPQAPAKVTKFEESVAMLERAVVNRRRDVAEAEAAVQKVAALKAAGAGDPVPEGVLVKMREEQALQEDLLRTLRTQQQQLDLATTAKANAVQTRDKATAAHNDVKQWTQIQELCAPSGLPAEDLAEVLDRINDRLTHTTMLSGWSHVIVRDDMEILVGGRLYGLCSESARFRADVLLAEAVCDATGFPFLVLDRIDVLVGEGRMQLYKLLHTLHKQGSPLRTLLLGAFKAAPTGLPSTFTVHWLQAGEIVAPTKEKEAA